MNGTELSMASCIANLSADAPLGSDHSLKIGVHRASYANGKSL
jgi:hypothetical protein